MPQLARFNEDDLPYVGVKAAMFSFTRLMGADPKLGVEMASTGEVGCIGENYEEALLLALEASGTKRPRKAVLVSSGGEKDKLKFLKSAETLKRLGLAIYATPGTAQHLREHGYEATQVDWPGEGPNDVLVPIRSKLVDLVINIPKTSDPLELERGGRVRQAAVRYGCPLLTNMEKVTDFFAALERCGNFLFEHKPLSLPPFR